MKIQNSIIFRKCTQCDIKDDVHSLHMNILNFMDGEKCTGVSSTIHDKLVKVTAQITSHLAEGSTFKSVYNYDAALPIHTEDIINFMGRGDQSKLNIRN